MKCEREAHRTGLKSALDSVLYGMAAATAASAKSTKNISVMSELTLGIPAPEPAPAAEQQFKLASVLLLVQVNARPAKLRLVWSRGHRWSPGRCARPQAWQGR